MLGGAGVHQPVFTRGRVAEKEFVIGGILRRAFYYMEGTTTPRLIRLLLRLLWTIAVPMTDLLAVEARARWFSFLLSTLRFLFLLLFCLLDEEGPVMALTKVEPSRFSLSMMRALTTWRSSVLGSARPSKKLDLMLS